MVQHTVRAASTDEILARGLANIAFGAALSCQGNWIGVLFTALARAAERCLGDFIAQQLTNTV